jgi:arylsulfatase A-like enzyme
MSKLSRRDFLKVVSTVSGAVTVSSVLPKPFSHSSPADKPSANIIIIVMDSMAAENLSLYGYRRNTVPNFEKFAERATVYHSHVAGGNYTSPGTASLLTGMYPWTHRAINISGLIARDHTQRNFFHLLGPGYTRLAYSQNPSPNHFFAQFLPDIETILYPGAFSVVERVVGNKFPGDLEPGYRVYDEFMASNAQVPASLLFGLTQRILLRRDLALAQNQDYGKGLPRISNYPIFFELKDVYDGIISTLEQLKPPYLTYFHLWAPHSPYRPTQEFDDLFANGWRPANKPPHRFSSQVPNSHLNTRRRYYDKYIANVDAEFGRLVHYMEETGILENSYVIVTSDHGESFERGLDGHITPLLYNPLVHIPLIISSPGQNFRKDIHSPTSCIDVLPTLLSIAGRDIPQWCEGKVLPGLGGVDDFERSIFTVEAKTNPAFAALERVTISMRKGQYKMICYTGYEAEDSFELYDLEHDMGELKDLYPLQPAVAKRMQFELLEKLHQSNQSYKK